MTGRRSVGRTTELYSRTPLRIKDAHDKGELPFDWRGVLAVLIDRIEYERLQHRPGEIVTSLADLKSNLCWRKTREALRLVLVGLERERWISATRTTGSTDWTITLAKAAVIETPEPSRPTDAGLQPPKTEGSSFGGSAQPPKAEARGFGGHLQTDEAVMAGNTRPVTEIGGSQPPNGSALRDREGERENDDGRREAAQAVEKLVAPLGTGTVSRSQRQAFEAAYSADPVWFKECVSTASRKNVPLAYLTAMVEKGERPRAASLSAAERLDRWLAKTGVEIGDESLVRSLLDEIFNLQAADLDEVVARWKADRANRAEAQKTEEPA